MTQLLATTAQQKLGIGFVVATLVVVAVYFVLHLRRRESPPPGSEIELAPNRKPYLSDEELEGPRLERAQLFVLAMMAIIAIGLPIYWLREPGRQAGAINGFAHRAEERGFELFQPADSTVHGAHFGCATCHGPKGEGGVANYSISDPANKDAPPRQVQWKAPALDTVLLRFSPEEVRTILVYGRANTPMPAWGVLGGGPMNDQQIDDLVAYLASIQLKPKDVQAANLKEYGTDGAKLFDAFCSRCHTKGWSYGESDVIGGGAFGPNLTNGATVRQFPARQDHIDFVGAGTEFAKPYGVRGIGSDAGGGMPGFAQMLTEDQIAAIVDYERRL
ncbi:MAG TPA: cytochrome c [Acidimicrobiales bacterium]|nr:cytochrome c [Acidimicrobiales bacterium]